MWSRGVILKKIILILIFTFSFSFLNSNAYAKEAMNLGFFYAIQEGDKALFDRHIAHNVDIETKYNHDVTPLLYATAYEQIGIVKELLALNANIHARDTYFANTPLMLACLTGNIEIVTLLLEHGAEINIENNFGLTPFFIAIEQNNEELISLLLAHNVDIHQENYHNTTSLMVASFFGNLNLVKYLIASGADIYHSNHAGDALCQASVTGKIDIIKYLFKLDKDYARQNTNAFKAACVQGNIELVKFYIKNKFNYKEISSDALIIAAEYAYTDLVKLLVRNGADVNAKDSSHMTPLMFAARQGNIDLVKYLIKNKADVHAINYQGFNAAELALFYDLNNENTICYDGYYEEGYEYQDGCYKDDDEKLNISEEHYKIVELLEKEMNK